MIQNLRVRILVVGLGSIGTRHIKNLLKFNDVEIIILTKRKNVKLKHKRIKIFNLLSKCLQEKPEIAFITNESSYHLKTTIKLAKLGLDLFIEKPLSDSLNGLDELKKIVGKNKLVTQVGCNLRFFPCIKKIKCLVNKRIVGKPISVQVETGSYLPDWHPNEDYSKGYAARKDLGGGILLTAIHEIDYLYWIFGKIDQVLSITGKFSNLKITADDLSTSIVKFKNNVVGEIHLDYFQRPYFKSIKIRCSKGIIKWETDSNDIKIFNSNSKKWTGVKVKNNYRLTSTYANTMYVDEITHFLRNVKKRKKTINDINQGIDVLKIALSIRKASQEKKAIRV